MKVDNAVIMAAGASSRFAPLSYERHKALTEVKGEVLIERQITQLKDAGIKDIYIVTGYKAEQFDFLVDKYDVRLLNNSEYLSRNNNGSIWIARNVLGNSYICSADNYFSLNPFENDVDESYYAAQYADGHTDEWCMEEDDEGYITSVTIGGDDSWYMLGHTFWSSDFSKRFLGILSGEYDMPETRNKLWEEIFINHLDELHMKIRKYPSEVIYEFDTMNELRKFDTSYVADTRSAIIKMIVSKLKVSEADIINISAIKGRTSEAIGIEFDAQNKHYKYLYDTKSISII